MSSAATTTTTTTTSIFDSFEPYFKPYYTDANKADVEAFLRTLNYQQYQAVQIARTQLQSSFDILKSNGFVEWKKKTSTPAAV